jgi:hypothetical protein
MIQSKTQVSVIPRQPDILKTVFVESVLEIKNGEYIATTSHYYEEDTRKILMYTGINLYSNQQINDMYDALKPQIENLPFTEQIQAGVEITLLYWFNTNDIYGIPANTDGWEII